MGANVEVIVPYSIRYSRGNIFVFFFDAKKGFLDFRISMKIIKHFFVYMTFNDFKLD